MKRMTTNPPAPGSRVTLDPEAWEWRDADRLVGIVQATGTPAVPGIDADTQANLPLTVSAPDPRMAAVVWYPGEHARWEYHDDLHENPRAITL